MAEITVNAEGRSDFGKNASRRLRAKGMVPAILYGGKGENVSVAVDPKSLLRVLRSEAGRNSILKLDIAGQGATNAILKGWQVDPIKENFLHADFFRIAMDVALRVTVPISIKGEARGVKVDGGILEIVIRQIEIECLPGDIPERIDVDVTDLGLNAAIHVADLQISNKVKVMQNPEQVVIHIISVKEEAATPAAGAAPAEGEAASSSEPEVVKKGKKDEEAEKK